MSPRLRILLIFALNAVLLGGFTARLAEVQLALGLTEAAFGLALTAQPVGFVLGTFVSARVTEAHGNRRAMIWVFGVTGLMPVLVGFATGFWTLFAAMFLFGLVPSFGNVALNVEADRVALATGRPLISKCHGAWGVGFLITSGLSVLAIRAGVTPLTQFWTMAVVVLAGTALLIGPLRESPPRAHSRDGAAPRFALPDRASFLLMGFALSGIVMEVIARSWAVIYLRDALGAVDWLAALALTAFIFAQTAGRLLADDVVLVIGEVPLGRVLAVITGAGLALLTVTGSVWLALFACGLLGLGASATFPMAMAALAKRTERPAAESLAGFTILQNVAFFVAPALFGIVASAVDLRAAMLILLPLPVIAFWFARNLTAPDDRR